MDYVLAGSRAEFDAAFSASFGSQNSTIIEVPTHSENDLARRKQFLEMVTARLQEERLAALQEDTYDELG